MKEWLNRLFCNYILNTNTEEQMLEIMEHYYHHGFEHHMTHYQAYMDKVDRANARLSVSG